MLKDPRAGALGRLISDLVIGDRFTTSDGKRCVFAGLAPERSASGFHQAMVDVYDLSADALRKAPVDIYMQSVKRIYMTPSTTVRLGWNPDDPGYLNEIQRNALAELNARRCRRLYVDLVIEDCNGSQRRVVFSAAEGASSYLRRHERNEKGQVRREGVQCFTGADVGASYMVADGSHDTLTATATRWVERTGLAKVLGSVPCNVYGRPV